MQRTFQIAAFGRPMGVGRPLLVPLGVEPQSLGLMVQSCAQGPASKHCAFPTPPPPVTKRNDKASAQTKGIGLFQSGTQVAMGLGCLVNSGSLPPVDPPWDSP